MTEVASQSHQELASAFAAAFPGSGPTGISVAPGRVNLIGDHTDYNNLPVFPMALQRTTRIMFRPRPDNVVRVASREFVGELREIEVSDQITPFGDGDWGNYVKAALQALVGPIVEPRGFDGLVSSDVPVASGLSSSAALVVAAAGAFMEVNDVRMPPEELAGVLALGERYVGTRGGGMDQAISLLSREGSAGLIRFDPLEFTSVEVPTEWRFVVASSMVRAEKSGDARRIYNARTEECRDALARVSRVLGCNEDYRVVMAVAEIAELLRLASGVLDAPLMERFRHVVSEGARVESAVAAMRSNDAVEFGRLMTQSHTSLRDDYEVSCVELNTLMDIAMDSGAVGARLTGAGFGGCIVALATADRADDVILGLRSRYFGAIPDRAIEEHLFLASPSAGARVLPI